MGPMSFWRNKSLLSLAGLSLLGVGVYVAANWPDGIGVPSSAVAPPAPPVQSVPGGRQTPEYARLQQMADQRRADRARLTQGSAVPSPSEMEPLAASPAPPDPARPPPSTPAPAGSPAPSSAPPAPVDNTAALTAEMTGAMKEQSKNLLKFRQRFEPQPTQMTSFEDIKEQRERAAAQKRADDLLQEARAARPSDRHGSLKPGNILFAVLQTAINSDEPGPVRAKIVGERFKNAILLGGLNPFPPVVGSRPERVLVKFRYLTTPDQVTYPIDAYAIDLETARTALATGVDHHYLERYGSLIAASFLEGYGEAIRDNNRITSVGVFGNVVSVPKNDLDHGEIAREALGTVGQRLGSAVAENFRRPNTITVNPGAGLGVLINSPTDSDSREPAAPPAAVSATQPPAPSWDGRDAPAAPPPTRVYPFAGARDEPAREESRNSLSD